MKKLSLSLDDKGVAGRKLLLVRWLNSDKMLERTT